jgi:hypothetical protein
LTSVRRVGGSSNRKITDKAPADYLKDQEILPTGTGGGLLVSHFIDETTLPLLLAAVEDLPNVQAAELYGRFVQAREAAIIQEIRRVCGIAQPEACAADDEIPDEVAEDVKVGDGTSQEEQVEDFELESA